MDLFPLEPLHAGRLVRRYKRFLADIELEDGTLVTAHCPNSGSMLGMNDPGSPVRLLHVSDPRRKLKWTWELVSPDGRTWVGCNTQRPNQVAAWAAAAGLIPGVDAGEVRREVRYGRNSRIDLLVGDHHIEVKNTTMARVAGGAQPAWGTGAASAAAMAPAGNSTATAPAGGGPVTARPDGSMTRMRTDAVLAGGEATAARGPAGSPSTPGAAGGGQAQAPADQRLDIPCGVAMFPDAVTVRGAKHMRELAAVAASGKPATVLFFVNRGDCDRFAVARHIDPAYADAFDEAVDAGVQMVPLGMDVSPEGWRVRGPLPIVG